MKRSQPSHSFAWLLTLLAPGLGHVYWAEHLFGIFVFLIMIIGMVLVFFCYLVTLPLMVRLILFGMPLLFFLFVFFDLSRSIRKKARTLRRSSRTAILFLIGALIGNVLFPLSPTNFLWRNGPEVVFSADDDLTPAIAAGSLYLVDRQAYSADLFFLDEPHFHSAPERFELVRIRLDDGDLKSVMLIGFPGEEVTMINDSLFIDGYPWDTQPDAIVLSGRLSLTQVGSGSILAVTFKQGVIHRAYSVPLDNLTGRVRRLF